MKIQETPDYLIFADESKTGELLDFPNVLRGWGVTIDQTQSKPPMEWMNGAFNRIDKNTLYLLQQGVPEWNASVLYPVSSIIKYKGILYVATVQNDNAIPSTNTTKWTKVIQDASLTQKGVAKLNSSIDSDIETEAATPKAVKLVNDKITALEESDIVYLSNFAYKHSETGYVKLPTGLIIQWFIVKTLSSEPASTFTLPIAFPNAGFHAWATHDDPYSNDNGIGFSAVSVDKTKLYARSIKMITNGNLSGNEVGLRILAIGY